MDPVWLLSWCGPEYDRGFVLNDAKHHLRFQCEHTNYREARRIYVQFQHPAILADCHVNELQRYRNHSAALSRPGISKQRCESIQRGRNHQLHIGGQSIHPGLSHWTPRASSVSQCPASICRSDEGLDHIHDASTLGSGNTIDVLYEIFGGIMIFRITVGLFIATAAFGNTISIDTASLEGNPNAPFTLDFQFIDGSGTGDANNTVTLTDFDLAGGSLALTSS